MDSLPVELRQMILSHLDPFAFQNALNASTVLKFASEDTTILRRHLQKLPLTSASRAALPQHGLGSLVKAQRRAAKRLLLGVHTKHFSSPFNNSEEPLRHGKVAFSKDGSRAVKLEARQLTLFSLRSSDGRPECRTICHRRLNGLRDPRRTGPILADAADQLFELAVADGSDLVAVALHRSVQLYDFSRVEESPLSVYVAAASGHFIAGVDFDCHNAALRLRLSKKGVVLYLGALDPPGYGAIADYESWKVTAGLSRVVLDSRKVIESSLTAVAGLQLLRSFGDGYIFAAQLYGAGPDASTAYGLLRISREAASSLNAGDDRIVSKLLLRLPKASACFAHQTAPYWSLQPTGKAEAFPLYCTSLDKDLLIVGEEWQAEHCGDAQMTQVFAFKLPDLETLEDQGIEERGGKGPSAIGSAVSSLDVESVPIFLAEVQGKLLSSECRRALSGRNYKVMLRSSEGSESLIVLRNI